MAKFVNEEVPYYIVNSIEIMLANNTNKPLCGECDKDLTGNKDIILIPMLKIPFCKSCANKWLRKLLFYKDNASLQKTQEKNIDFYNERLI